MSRSWDQVEASPVSQRTSNPIRRIVDKLKINPDAEKEVIKLSIGDPTVYGNLHAPQCAADAMARHASSGDRNGYCHSEGYADVRRTIAERFGDPDHHPLTANDVILTSGCSHALDMCFTVMASEGDNILIPKPGFALYKTQCDSKGIETRPYRLDPARSWEADLEHMQSLIDDRTRAILVNNPSNPCGSVYSADHLRAILQIAERHCVPIIADEIYAHMVFPGSTFTSLASLSHTVPILSVGGLAKQYLVPGWRVGWILVHDRQEIFARSVRDGLNRLSTLILAPNTVAQAAAADIIRETPTEFYTSLNATLAHHAEVCQERIGHIPGLGVVQPQGAMYVMVEVEVDHLSGLCDDVEFCQQLLAEENVVVLPGQCFAMPNFFRIVSCPPPETLNAAFDRIQSFCERRFIKNNDNHS
eukprot:gb/GECH01007824.1/.p1 GENE.gb/GECH01007824.1/~~gb/GECH01007824.1/.p1  ORF type:complete len:417 (+),score=66.46 gb/GECH01007824.1/:1-1251(+)